MAFATILRLPDGAQPLDQAVTCPECGWQRWEHQQRPEHCEWLT